jgi:signal transduction histidine kinase
MRRGDTPGTLSRMDHRCDAPARPSGQLERWLKGLDWRHDLALPMVLLILQLAGTVATVAGHHSPARHVGAADWLLLIVGPLSLLFWRRWPVAVLWVAFAATLTPSGAWPADLSLIVAFFLAATSGHRYAAWVVIAVGYLSSVWLAPLAFGNRGVSLTFALALGGWLAVLVIAAEVVRLSRERAADARSARAVDARRRASEERLRMARDLHDVIGHNISLINVQAGAGLDLMDTQPDAARAALSAIKTASKEALEELRAMLAALRNAGEDAPRAPTPGLGRLDELVELTRAAGIAVVLQTVGECRPLPAAVDLAAYRIVQESLTNVARHACSAIATVRLAYRVDGLDVEISDDGRAAMGNGSRLPGTGSGIAGMRERALALGGRFSAEPRNSGGFTVSAHLPLGGTS